jgi:predicted GH43/DUF377 family glycosyl hydrolase
MKKILACFWLLLCFVNALAQSTLQVVSPIVMQSIYKKIKTPYKYGLVVVSEKKSKKIDSPSVFRKNGQWFMTYIVFDERGYETWLAKSDDLLHWTTTGKILSFSDTTHWDINQKAGYLSLLDYTWGGSYKPQTFGGKYWMSYLGGSSRGYEAGLLSIGMAYTFNNITQPHEWKRLDKPVLKATDTDSRWWENITLYKSSVIHDKTIVTGYPFVMFYNAKGDGLKKNEAERIGMAVSNDMEHWKRYCKDPVLDHHEGITGDAVIQKIDAVWVMFYFGAFWKDHPGAFNRFACSYDLVHWTDWKGDDLIKSSKPYDEQFAHKSFVVKYKGVVYHFYCAVSKEDQRGIAVATSTDMGRSVLQFARE